MRAFPSDSLNLEVRLTNMPYGTPDDDAFLWREEKRTVRITPGK